MSRARERREAARLKRQVPNHFPDAGKMVEDYDDTDEPECTRCRGDGMDPWCDYLLPCPECQGEQQP